LKRWQFWLGIAISLAFMWYVMRGLHLRAFWEVLRHANYWWLLPGVGVYFLAVWARAWRWHYLLRPLKSIPTKTMFPIVAIGYMGNNIYPATSTLPAPASFCGHTFCAARSRYRSRHH